MIDTDHLRAVLVAGKHLQCDERHNCLNIDSRVAANQK